MGWRHLITAMVGTISLILGFESLIKAPAHKPDLNGGLISTDNRLLGSSLDIAREQTRTILDTVAEPCSHSVHRVRVGAMWTREIGGQRGEALETRGIDLDPSRDFHARGWAFKH
jgi:hypothetical protein